PAPVNAVPAPPVAPMPQWGNPAPVNAVPAPPVAPMPQWGNPVPVNAVPAPPVPPMPQAPNSAPVNNNQPDVPDTDNIANQTSPVNQTTANQQQAGFINNVYQAEYQQKYNQSIPHIEYVPYVVGAPLPQGVVPQFINGGWYYPVTVDGKKNKKAKKNKKKMKTSVKVFMGIMVGMTILSIGLFVGWLIKSGVNEQLPNNPFDLDSSISEKSDDKKEQIGLLANPNGPEIKLNSNETKDGSTEKAYEVLSDSVVSVAVYSDGEDPATGSPISEGTGIIVSEDGYIATNSHVILDDISSDVWVTTKSGDTYSVGVVGCDVRTDLAVLLCDEAKKWKAADFANSDEIKVGQDVVALGSPGGSSYSNSLTRGIVSALDRALSGTAVTYIQTDAAINPGNSGGPLANMNGQVIGINTIKVVDTQFEGMGFAIPSTKIKEVVDELIKNGYVTGRARLGVMVTEFSSETAKYYNAKPGVKIETIEKESSFYDSDVKKGDIVTAIDGKSVTSLASLFDVLDSYKEGDTVEVTVYRIDKKNTEKNKEFKIKVKLLGD
ncbi:MAG: trypsin-like peptidase domain-containing protein, partial [Acutalibacteraceae bacterium]|nr:trypsin-like peptidase domain-containing protein [Acutalibacteraceae bacterium]